MTSEYLSAFETFKNKRKEINSTAIIRKYGSTFYVGMR